MGYGFTLNQIYVLNSLDGNPRYGLDIIRFLENEHGIKLILGSLYNVLAKLERDGLIESYYGEKTKERGNRRKRYYKLTGAGQAALAEVRYNLSRSFNFKMA